jgi:carbamate kinase
LLRRGEPMTLDSQRANVRRAVTALLPLFEAGHQLVITHGNGPQVGLLALQAAAGPEEGAYGLDVLDAESEGMVGYLIEQELDNALPGGRLVATLLTQIVVDGRDPAFRRPTKPIGPVYDRAQAERLAQARGWRIAQDGKGWRRVVASPRPQQILEVRVIELLVSQGVTVICAGGGGIPVVELSDGALIGVEAVIDKDLAPAPCRSAPAADRCRRGLRRLGNRGGQADQESGSCRIEPGRFRAGVHAPEDRGSDGLCGRDRQVGVDRPPGGCRGRCGRCRRHPN